MKDWLEVDTARFRQDRTEEIRQGVQVKMAVSPYDVPQGVRGYTDKTTSNFVIEFKYLVEDEPHVQTAHENPHVRVEIGKNSKRIYRIMLDVVALKCDLVRLAVDAIEELPREHNRLSNSYDLTKQIVLQNRDKLLPV